MVGRGGFTSAEALLAWLEARNQALGATHTHTPALTRGVRAWTRASGRATLRRRHVWRPGTDEGKMRHGSLVI